MEATTRFYLSSNSPWRATFLSEEGHVVYQADSPSTFLGTIPSTKILRVVPYLAPNDTGAGVGSSLAHLAEIEYHTFSDSRIRYAGNDQPASEVLRRKGWTGKHVFIGPDGAEYVWKLGTRSCNLFFNGSQTLVAAFHPEKGGFIRKFQLASLEIFNTGNHMIDLIVITLIYLTKLRKDRERSGHGSSHSSAAGGGFGGGGGGFGGGGM